MDRMAALLRSCTVAKALPFAILVCVCSRLVEKPSIVTSENVPGTVESWNGILVFTSMGQQFENIVSGDNTDGNIAGSHDCIGCVVFAFSGKSNKILCVATTNVSLLAQTRWRRSFQKILIGGFASSATADRKRSYVLYLVENFSK